MAAYEGNEGILQLGTTTFDHFVGWTGEDSTNPVNTTQQNDGFSNVAAGIRSMTVNATIYVGEADAPPESGQSGALTLTYKAGDTTPGTIEGDFLVASASHRYQIGSAYAVDLRLQNQGAFSIVEPTGVGP